MTPEGMKSLLHFSREVTADANYTRRIFEMVEHFYSPFERVKHPDLVTFRRNPSANAPYHNNLHQATVALTARFILETGGSKELSLKAVEDLGVPRHKDWPTVIAGLFHDYAHSGGALDDHLNIARATSVVQGLDIHPEIMNEVLSLIAVTEYPFIREPKTEGEKALRDADLACALLLTPSMYFQQYIMGLRTEMVVKLGKSLSIREFAQGQMKFIDSIKFYAIEGTVLEKQYRDFNNEFYTALLACEGID